MALFPSLTLYPSTSLYPSPVPITIEIDWNKDGDYSDTYSNVYSSAEEDTTSRVMASFGVSVEDGLDQSTALAPMVAGRGGFTLNNASGDYNPLNTSSPGARILMPALPSWPQAFVRHGSTDR